MELSGSLFTSGPATSGWEVGVQRRADGIAVIGLFDHVLLDGGPVGELGDDEIGWLATVSMALLDADATWVVRCNRSFFAMVAGYFPWSRRRRPLKRARAAWCHRGLERMVVAFPPRAHDAALHLLEAAGDGYSRDLRFIAGCRAPPPEALGSERQLDSGGLVAWFERHPAPLIAVDDGHAYAACPADELPALLELVQRLADRLGVGIAADRVLEVSPFDALTRPAP